METSGNGARSSPVSKTVRVRGTVQGVGFRPMIWRLARDCGLAGDVGNDGAGVLIRLFGPADAIAGFLDRIGPEAPPLSRIDTIEVIDNEDNCISQAFRIVESTGGETRTQVTPDAATCPACRDEVFKPSERRFRYPFTNCTHCGPRFSIIENVPYDRTNTTMAEFAMCDKCGREYRDTEDRRFHAQPIACPDCGPRAWLEPLNDQSGQLPGDCDQVDAAADLIAQGAIIAVRGIGGFHIACDATNPETVAQLRSGKHRFGKPFALMARDIRIIRQFCHVGDEEQKLLESPEAPIVILQMNKTNSLPEAIAPGMNTLGFMLPYTPLHQLLLQNIDKPIVMTSGNLSDEPQVISNDDARNKLKNIADYALFHNRDIANRIDDSIVRVMAEIPRILRRARGYAPGAIALPAGFENAPDLLAYGGELKATFCLVKDGAAILSQHQGDLENPATFDDYLKNLALYRQLYDHDPKLLVIDKHVEYLSSKLGKTEAIEAELPIEEVQHHHAHIASCMAENAMELNAAAVLGIALDGLGYGDDGNLWGGEFLLADYRGYKRLGTFKPVAMLGGAQAIHQPWRNTYAHLYAGFDWQQLSNDYSSLELFEFLQDKPLGMLNQMLKKNINAPLASSCGRLFDAVAAALGLCRDRADYEGQGAIELEAIVCENALQNESDAQAYSFDISKPEAGGLLEINSTPMWQALLKDIRSNESEPAMAARFHKGLALAIIDMVDRLKTGMELAGKPFHTVALSGGCFQNRILLEQVIERLGLLELKIITQSRVPANDGGLALGQAAIAAARHLGDSVNKGEN